MDRASQPRALVLAAALALLVLAALTTGCSTDSKVLAQVGDRKITAGEFRDLSKLAATRYLMPPDSAKAKLLDVCQIFGYGEIDATAGGPAYDNILSSI
jgi:hypothetical protein